MKKIGFILLILTTLVQAKDSFFSKKDFSVAIGAQGNSLLYKRGIITHKGYQVFPIYAVSLFNPNLLLAGSALYYKLNLGEKFSVRTRLNFDATNDEPLYYTNEDEEDRVRRDKTNELDFFLQYDFTHSSYIRFQSSKDLVAHKGSYYELKIRYDLLDQGEKRLVQPGLFISAGYGDKDHNTYLYGIGANKDSVNNIEYGFSITSPRAIDNFWPTLKITKFEILGDENRSGSFVQEREGFSVEALMAFKAW